MVINYKKMDKNTKFDRYYILNKEILINLASGKNYYSKFDCKSGFWQIKIENDSTPITTSSTPKGHYEWMVMPFGLKMLLKFSKEKWIIYYLIIQLL